MYITTILESMLLWISWFDGFWLDSYLKKVYDLNLIVERDVKIENVVTNSHSYRVKNNAFTLGILLIYFDINMVSNVIFY